MLSAEFMNSLGWTHNDYSIIKCGECWIPKFVEGRFEVQLINGEWSVQFDTSYNDVSCFSEILEYLYECGKIDQKKIDLKNLEENLRQFLYEEKNRV